MMIVRFNSLYYIGTATNGIVSVWHNVSYPTYQDA
jgi:hypothetical protein